MIKFNCPNCGSENTSAFRVIYQNGHSVGQQTTYGVVGTQYNTATTTTTKTFGDGHKETSKDVQTTAVPIYGDIVTPTYSLTDLARKCVPPEQPKEPQYKPVVESTSERITESILAVICSGCCLGCLGYFLIGMIATYLMIEYATAENLYYIISAIIIIVLCVKADKAWRRRRKENTEYNTNLRIQYENDMEIYNRQLEIWERSYICMRCGCRYMINDDGNITML